MIVSEEFSLMWKFYLLSAVTALTNGSYIIFALYLLELGWSTTLIGSGFALVSLAIILFEIPTGVIADVFGRKISGVLGFLIMGLSMIILLLSRETVWLMIYFFLTGFGFTFLSGAVDAWFVDYYLHYGKKKNLDKIISRRGSVTSIASFFSYILASIILLVFKDSIGFSNTCRLIFLIECVAFLSAGVIGLLIKEPYFKKKKLANYFSSSVKEVKAVFKKSVSAIFSNKKLFYIFAGFMIFFFGTTAVSSGWQIHFSNNNIPSELFGIIFGSVYLISSIVLYFNNRITKKFGIKRVIMFGLVIFSLLQIVISLNLGAWLIIPFLLQAGVFWDLTVTNTSIQMNKIIKPKLRATILSLKGVADNIPTMLGEVLLFGLVTDLFNINTSLFIGGIVLFLSGLLINKV